MLGQAEQTVEIPPAGEAPSVPSPRSASAAWAKVGAVASAWVVPAVIVLDLAVVCWLGIRLNIWVDEAYTLQTASGGLPYAFHQAIFWELQPPVYFLLIALLRFVTFSVFAARLFSIVCVAATLVLAAAISRSLWPSLHPAWLVSVLAFNPFVVGIAVEIRVYALVLLLSALLFYLFLHAYVLPSQTDETLGVDVRIARTAFIAVAILALYTHYYLGFLLPAFAVALLVTRNGAALRAYLWGMMVVGLFAVPILFVIRHQVATNSVNFSSDLSPLTALLHESKILVAAFLSADGLPRVVKRALLFACVLATAGIIAVVWRERVRMTARDTIPFIVAGIAGVSLVLVLAAAHQSLTLRYSTALFLPAMLCIYAVLALVPGRIRIAMLAGWTMLALATSALSLATQYKEMAKIGDWSRVASYLQAHESLGQPIVIFEPQAALPLAHYYHGANHVVPLPRPVDLIHYDLREAALQSSRDVSTVFEHAGSAHGYMWLVTTDFCRREPINFHCELLDNYIADHYKIWSDEHFYWSRVRLLERVR
jgi:hypothetical protein